MVDFLNLSVCAMVVLYLSGCLISILWVVILSLNIPFRFPLSIPAFANFIINLVLRVFRFSRLSSINALSYVVYLSRSTSLAKDFCVLSKSAFSSQVRLLPQTTQDCSKTLRQYIFQRWTISSLLDPKLWTALSNCNVPCFDHQSEHNLLTLILATFLYITLT